MVYMLCTFGHFIGHAFIKDKTYTNYKMKQTDIIQLLDSNIQPKLEILALQNIFVNFCVNIVAISKKEMYLAPIFGIDNIILLPSIKKVRKIRSKPNLPKKLFF